MNLPEDARPLAGFYPDTQLRAKLHRAFAQIYLPREARRGPFEFFCQASLNPTSFIQARWQMLERETNLPGVPTPSSEPPAIRRITDLSASIEEVAGYPALLVQMPPPVLPGCRSLVAVVLLVPAREVWLALQQTHRHALGTGPAPAPEQLARFDHAGVQVDAAQWTGDLPGVAAPRPSPEDQAAFLRGVAQDLPPLVFHATEAATPPLPGADFAKLDLQLRTLLLHPATRNSPTFPAVGYLAPFARIILTEALRVARQPDLVEEIQIGHTDACSHCQRAGPLTAWVFDFEATDETGRSGRDEFIERVNHPKEPAPATDGRSIGEKILVRGVDLILTQPLATRTEPLDARELGRGRTIGWYVAGLIMPAGWNRR